IGYPVALSAIVATSCGSNASSSTAIVDASGSRNDGSSTLIVDSVSPPSDAGAASAETLPSTAESGACATACSGAHVVCDPADGLCKPDGTTTAIGAPCLKSGADAVCGSDPNATCNNQVEDGFPGGYCSFEPCSTAKLCPLGSTCATLGGE